MMRKKPLIGVATLLIVVISFVAIAGCAAPREAPQKSVELVSNAAPSIVSILSSHWVKITEDISDVKATMKVRPSMTSRFVALREGKSAMVGWSMYLWPAAYGKVTYAEPEWGPQKVRLVFASKAATPLSMMATADCGIKKISDLKGKRVIWHQGAPSRQLTTEAYLRFGGLTWDDVEKVSAPGYNEAIQMIIDGRADAAYASIRSAKWKELEASRRGTVVLDFPKANEQGWHKINEMLPFLAPVTVTEGPGDPESYPKTITGTILLGACGPGLDNTIVRSLAEAALLHDEEFFTGNPQLDPDNIGLEILEDREYRDKYWGYPFHPGFIEYLKDKGVWTEEDDAWQTKMLEEEKDRIREFKAAH